MYRKGHRQHDFSQSNDVKLPVNHRAYPASIYLLKVNNRNTRKRYKLCSKLTIKTPEQRHWHRSGVFFVNAELTSQLVLVFLLLTLSM